MSDFESMIEGMLTVRADAIEKFLAKHNVNESSEEYTMTNDYTEDGHEVITLWRLSKVATLKLNFTVRAKENSDE